MNDFLNYKNELKADHTPQVLDNRSLSPNANELVLEEFSQRLNTLDTSPKLIVDPNANTPPPSPADYKIDSKTDTSASVPFDGKFTIRN